MTHKDLRINYCQEAVNPPFSEMFHLDIEENEDDVEEYIVWLEEMVIASKEIVLELQNEIVILKSKK